MDTTTTNGTKKQRDQRTDVLLKDPTLELCLFGGATLLDASERGPLDTEDDPSSPYHDPRLTLPLDVNKVRNVNLLGVLETVLVTRVGDVLIVIDGRQRVRWARAANKLRAERGEPLIRVKCDPVRLAATDRSYALSIMIAANEVRTDDDISAKLDKVKRLMAAGVDVHGVADVVGKPVGVIESWLRFDDTAIDDVKRAVEAGQLAMSAGMSIARLRDPAQQAQALREVSSTNGKPVSTRKARDVAKRIEKPDAHVGVSDKRTQKALLKLVVDKDHPKSTSKETFAWWEGVEAALALIVGGDDKPDERLLALLGEARLTMAKGDK